MPATIEEFLNNPRRKRIKLIERGPPNPAHYYEIDGSSRGVISTTTLLHKYFPPFDADLVIANLMVRPSWPKHYLYGKSPEEIRDKWSRAGPKGTAMHQNFDNYNKGFLYDCNTKELPVYMQWRRMNPYYEHVVSEYIIGSKVAMIGGAVDAFYRDKRDGQYIMVDYKRARNVRTQAFCECNNPFGITKPLRHQRTLNFAPGHDPDTCTGYGTHPLTEHLPNCNHITYSLQQHVYGHLTEHPKLYDFPLKAQYLWHVKPPRYDHFFIPVAPLRGVAEAIISERVRDVRAAFY